MLDWLIIGGGIHGTTLSFYLTRLKGVPRDRLRVLDPHERPLAMWDQFTRNVGMTYLRSPHVQSLDVDPWSISTFAKTRSGQPLADYIPTHNRPSLALFRAHSDWMIDRHGLDTLRLTGHAERLQQTQDGWCVETDRGPIAARNVILALGASEQPRWPEWAANLRNAGAPVQHVFEPTFSRDDLPHWSHAVVVGGGISAAQLAIALAEREPGRVTLLMRQPARVFPFDSDLCWVSEQCQRGFRAIPDLDERRRVIKQARHAGSMPAEIHAALQKSARDGRLKVVVDQAASVSSDYTKGIELRLESGAILRADQIVLATGFNPVRPGGAMLDQAVGDYALPVAPCGYPVVTSTLAWSDGLYVNGPLAELEVGPVSRNIIGARIAAERIGHTVADLDERTGQWRANAGILSVMIPLRELAR